MPEAAPKPPAGAAGATPGTFVDPYRAYHFKIDIQGVTAGHFTECSGLRVKVEDIKYREAGMGQIVRRLPGRVQYGDVTLRYGLTSSTELWSWLMAAVAGTVAPRDISILVLQRDGATEALRWNLERAWPSEWCGAPLDALGNEAAIESLTLVYERIERV
jgi:phage tail-like protein